MKCLALILLLVSSCMAACSVTVNQALDTRAQESRCFTSTSTGVSDQGFRVGSFSYSLHATILGDNYVVTVGTVSDSSTSTSCASFEAAPSIAPRDCAASPCMDSASNVPLTAGTQLAIMIRCSNVVNTCDFSGINIASEMRLCSSSGTTSLSPCKTFRDNTLNAIPAAGATRCLHPSVSGILPDPPHRYASINYFLDPSTLDSYTVTYGTVAATATDTSCASFVAKGAPNPCNVGVACSTPLRQFLLESNRQPSVMITCRNLQQNCDFERNSNVQLCADNAPVTTSGASSVAVAGGVLVLLALLLL